MLTFFGLPRRYLALLFFIAFVLLADDFQELIPNFSTLRRLSHETGILENHAAKWSPSATPELGDCKHATLKEVYYRITTLETKLYQQAIDLDKLHRKVHTLDEALRLKSGESSGEISPALPVIGTLSTGEVRRVDEFWPHQWHTSKVASFAKQYTPRPGIPVALTWLDIGNDQNPRVRCYSSEIKETHFKISIDGWAGTKLYEARCAWLEIEADFQSGTYSTEEDHSWLEPRKVNSRNVIFSRQYTTAPRVVVWLSQIDMRRNRNWCVKAYATQVTATGFTLHIDTWGDSELHTAAASWVSYTPGIPGVFDGSFGTSGPSGQLSTTGHAEFDKNSFALPPRVIVGINSLDIDCDRNLRLAVWTTAVSSTGMTWHLDSWRDTKLYSAGASYIALS